MDESFRNQLPTIRKNRLCNICMYLCDVCMQSNCFGVAFQEKVDLGEIMLSLCYLPTAGRLTVTIIKARNLKAMDITGSSGWSRDLS